MVIGTVISGILLALIGKYLEDIPEDFYMWFSGCLRILPDEPIFDTYSLKQVTDDEVKAVEQGKGE